MKIATLDRTRNNAVLASVAGIGLVWAMCLGFRNETSPPVASVAPEPAQTFAQTDDAVVAAAKKPAIDRTGRARFGKASFYADNFAGKKMADGTRMDPNDDNAASRTLPLGTTAKVTNLENGKSAVVTIQDRGPYVDGRIVDLSPATAQAIGLSHKQGITRVAVVPIAVPMPDGRIKLGAAANDPRLAAMAANLPARSRNSLD